MGRYKKTGLFFGTYGSVQMRFENFEHDAKVRFLEERLEKAEIEKEAEEKRRGLEELKKAGAKFYADEVVFVARDRTRQLIWLEKGTSNAGLEHIIKNHGRNFESKLRINTSEIPNAIKDIIGNGIVEYQRTVNKNGNVGYEKLYKYHGKHYFVAGIGTNGFIITVYPKHDDEAADLIRRYKK